jgi:glucosamine-6-phosphate deaminase
MKSNLENKPDISYESPGKFEDTRFEKIHNVLFKNAAEASIIVAREIADLIKAKQQNKENCVLGLATGSSPIMVYEELCVREKDLVSVM